MCEVREFRQGETIEDVILRHSRRGMLVLREYLPEDYCRQAAAKLLELSRGTVLLTTGFYVAGYAETDGPVGTWALAKALKKLGFRPVIVTDEFCRDFFESEGLEVEYVEISAGEEVYAELLAKYQPVALVAIERCGCNINGVYANMRGVVIDEYTARIDLLFELGREQGIPRFGVGDGGNEIGMGNLRQVISEKLALVPCAAEVDYLVVATVSNWGAYGLCAAMEQQSGVSVLPGFAACRDFIAATVAVGSVDGVTHELVCSVDGFGMDVEQEILDSLRFFK